MFTSYSVLDSGNLVHYRFDDGKTKKSEDEIYLLETKYKVGEVDADVYNDQLPSWEAKSSKRGVNVYRFSGDKRAENVPKRTKEITPRKLKKKQVLTYSWFSSENVDESRLAKKDPRKSYRNNAAKLQKLFWADYDLEVRLKAAKSDEEVMDNQFPERDYDREMINYHEEKERSDRDRILQDIFFKEFDDELHAQLLKESTEAWERSKNNSDYIYEEQAA